MPRRKTADEPVAVSAEPADFLRRIAADIESAGGEVAPLADRAGSIGATMFDSPGSEDSTVTVLLPSDDIPRAPSQSLLRIKSRDGKTYLGIVSAGPFAEPDSLRADSPMMVTVVTNGGGRDVYLPPFHGRVQVTLMGEELADGTLVPPRWRPLPNSPVFVLAEAEAAGVLKTDGDIRLGLVVGHEAIPACVPSDQKSVLPRHTAILGTTGGGKSTTVAGLVKQARAAGMAVVLLDVEGEYSHLHEPTEDRKMLAALADKGLTPGGIPPESMTLYHLVGRDSANPTHPNLKAFSLQFARLSPYAAMEILDLGDAQQERFLKAYDIAKELLRDMKIFPRDKNAEDERLALEIDEFDRGYPRITLQLLLDIVAACIARADKSSSAAGKGKKDADEEPPPAPAFRINTAWLDTAEGHRHLQTRLHSMSVPGNAISWRSLLGRLGRLNRLKAFHAEGGVAPMNYRALLKPGQVSVIDLSDTGASEMNNLVIADMLRGIQEAQDDAYRQYDSGKATGAPPPTRVLIVVEEAHEFLGADRIDKMSTLFQQVARIAKRGRKRWLGLTFVTQLPQHLPRQVFGLVNSYVLHKITDPQVVQSLRKTVSGIDEGLWDRLSGLAPGQAIVSFPHMTRPLLVAIDPTPAKLRLVD